MILLLGSVAGGIAACAAVVAPRRTDLLALVVALACLLASGAALAAIASGTHRIDATAAAAFIAIGGALGGFALGSSLTPSFTSVPQPTIPGVLSPDDERVRFVVLADAEPESYHPASVTIAFLELGDSDLELPPDAARSFAYLADKTRYRSAGLSPARPIVRALAERVQARLREAVPDAAVLVAFTPMPPRLADVVVREAADGGRRFVIAPLDVASTRRMDVAERETHALGLEGEGVALSWATPLWGRTDIARLVAGRILSEVDPAAGENHGIVLAALGQPEPWQRDYPEWGEQETYFCQRVRALLEAGGLPADHVRLAWLDWQQPDVLEAVRHLAAIGSTQITIVPAVMPFDSLETVVDLRLTAEHAASESDVPVSVLPAWGDDEVVVNAIADSMLAVLADSDT